MARAGDGRTPPPAAYHTPVLVDEVIRYLVTKPDGVYVDGTLGGGGHAEALLRQLAPAGRVIGMDRDSDALAFAGQRLGAYRGQVTLVQANFSEMRSMMLRESIEYADGVLLDLGVSSHQIDSPDRGFSFQAPGALDMRMDRSSQGPTAASIIQSYDEERLADLFWRYGEERNSRRIARSIVRARQEGRPLGTTADLAAVIESSVSGAFAQKTLARVFQALRIAVNGELAHLTQFLEDVPGLLARGGRVVVISYHSLEDRIVKDAFRKESATVIKSAHALIPDTVRSARLSVLTKKPVVPTEREQAQNPRARSAKLRAAERIN